MLESPWRSTGEYRAGLFGSVHVSDSFRLALAVTGGLGAGVIVCLSFLVAPLVFKTLDGPSASRFLRALFPRYYRALLALSVLATALAIAGIPAGRWPASLWLLAAAGSLMLIPAINSARDAGPAGEARFRRLHGLSVGLNLVMLLACGWIVAAISRLPAPG
jgi:hypothetical protein